MKPKTAEERVKLEDSIGIAMHGEPWTIKVDGIIFSRYVYKHIAEEQLGRFIEFHNTTVEMFCAVVDEVLDKPIEISSDEVITAIREKLGVKP